MRSRQSAALDIDADDVQGEFQDDTQNDLVSLRSDNEIGGRGRSHTIVSYSNTRSVFGVDAAFENRTERSNTPDAPFGIANVRFDRQLSVRDYAVRQELAWGFGRHVIETGGELHRLTTNLGFVIDGDRNPSAANGSSVEGGAGLPDRIDSSRQSTRGGAWLIDTWQVHTRLSVEAGLRVDKGGVAGDTTVSPRATAQIQVTPSARLRLAAGRYTQSAGYEKLIQSDYVLDVTAPEATRLRSERADQLAAGIEQGLPSGAMVRMEGYYKRFQDLLVGRLETESERLARVATYDFPSTLAGSVPSQAIITTVPINGGAGRAYGLDIFITRPKAPAAARLRGWASYTVGPHRTRRLRSPLRVRVRPASRIQRRGWLPAVVAMGTQCDRAAGLGVSPHATAGATRGQSGG